MSTHEAIYPPFPTAGPHLNFEFACTDSETGVKVHANLLASKEQLMKHPAPEQILAEGIRHCMKQVLDKINDQTFSINAPENFEVATDVADTNESE